MWEQLLQREVVVSLAIVGAVAATAGAWLRHRGTSPAGPVLYWAGYTVTGISIALFIIAGLWGVKP